MWDGYPSPVAQMGPMARTVSDVAKLLDGMVGYDPEDPVTALGIGKIDGSYTRYLDRNGLKGARIGVLREPIGVPTEAEPGRLQNRQARFQKENPQPKKSRRNNRRPGLIPDNQGPPATPAPQPHRTQPAPPG